MVFRTGEEKIHPLDSAMLLRCQYSVRSKKKKLVQKIHTKMIILFYLFKKKKPTYSQLTPLALYR